MIASTLPDGRSSFSELVPPVDAQPASASRTTAGRFLIIPPERMWAPIRVAKPSVAVSDAIHFHLRAYGQPCDAHCTARREAIGEVCFVDVVELAPLRDVGEHHRALHEIAHGVPMSLAG